MPARPAAHNLRFVGLPKVPCVYAAELSNGVVKIGCSGMARYRMQSLSQEVRRDHGAELLRFHIEPRPSVRVAFHAESAALVLLLEIAQPLPGKREYFTGITFDTAVEVVVRAAALSA